jgi:hypothetical protein
LLIIGNLVLPAVCHFVPNGGLIFLPIFFFTLIAAYKFGLAIGLITAFASPIINYLIFEMPNLEFLPLILMKSGFLALLAWFIARKTQKISLILISVIILAYQFFGFMFEGAFFADFSVAAHHLLLATPGMLLQIIVGFLILKKIAAK